MKLNKFSKVIYTIASLCCLCVGSSNALKPEILNARANTPTTNSPATGTVIGKGVYGEVCELANDNNRLLKVAYTWTHTKDTVNEMDLANMMCSDDVPDSLMKVYQVGHPTKETFWYTFEKINGCSAKDYLQQIKDGKKGKIPWDTFCRHWCVGLFEGMKYVKDRVGIVTKHNSFTKKDEDYFVILGDRNASNIMVREDMIPVHIDYGFADHNLISTTDKEPNKNIRELTEMLLAYLRKNTGVEVPTTEKPRKKELYAFLRDVKEMPTSKDMLENIIKNIKNITGIN